MINLKTILYKQSPNFSMRARYKSNKITHIIIHTTEGQWLGCINWLCNPRSKVSAHYVISKKGEIIHLVQNKYAAWHVGLANGFTIGVEHEGFINDPNWITKELWNTSIELSAALCKEYNIPVENIIGHNDKLMIKYGNNHQDPGTAWNMIEYRKQIKEKLEIL